MKLVYLVINIKYNFDKNVAVVYVFYINYLLSYLFYTAHSYSINFIANKMFSL